jgi:hypothetical protein
MNIAVAMLFTGASATNMKFEKLRCETLEDACQYSLGS